MIILLLPSRTCAPLSTGTSSFCQMLPNANFWYIRLITNFNVNKVSCVSTSYYRIAAVNNLYTHNRSQHCSAIDQRCEVNTGFELPLLVVELSQKLLAPLSQPLGCGLFGRCCQNRRYHFGVNDWAGRLINESVYLHAWRSDMTWDSIGGMFLILKIIAESWNFNSLPHHHPTKIQH